MELQVHSSPLTRAQTVSLWLMISGIALWFVINFFYGEHVQVNDGLGWDGVEYANMATKFWFLMHGKLISQYYIQRIFPSFIIHELSVLFYALEDPLHIIRAFYIYNSFLLLLGVIVFFRIARLMSWSFPVIVIGFSALFLNFYVLKNALFYPVLTDYTAFVVGIFMLYFYLKDNSIGLLITTVIGAFTFPSTILLSGIILLLFPKTMNATNQIRSFSFSCDFTRYKLLIALGFSVALILLALYFLHSLQPDGFPKRILTPAWALISGKSYSVLNVLKGIFVLACVFIYSFLMILPFIRAFAIKISILRFATVIFLVLLIRLVQSYLASNDPGPVTALIFIEYLLTVPLAYPFVFILGSFLFYGPFILLVILFWNKIVDIAYSKSIAFPMLLLLYAVLALDSEARKIINIAPLFVFLLCEVLQKEKVSLNFASGMFIVSLFVSKFWLPINFYHWNSPGSWAVAYAKFPYQLYFMNFGAWLSERMYWIQMAVMLLVFFVLWRWKRAQLA